MPTSSLDAAIQSINRLPATDGREEAQDKSVCIRVNLWLEKGSYV